jgi:CheY-like chemotaxis protein
LGGSLQVSSEYGIGSEFVLTIDAGESATDTMLRDSSELDTELPSPVEPVSEVLLQGTILLAEDNENNQRLLELYLNKMGAHVTIAENGEKALAYASAQNYDLVFMDMQMPVMSGIDAVRRLRQRGYTGPIVALTANANSEDRRQCMEAGCDYFITKPIMRDQLYRVTHRYLRPATQAAAATELLTSKLWEEDAEFCDVVIQFVEKLPDYISTIRNAY